MDYDSAYKAAYMAAYKAIVATGDAYKNLSWFGKNKAVAKEAKKAA